MAFYGTLKFDTAIDKTGFKLGLDSLGSLATKGTAAVTAAVTLLPELSRLSADTLSAWVRILKAAWLKSLRLWASQRTRFRTA